MLHDISITAEQLKAAAEWASTGESMAPVELAVDDCMLVASQSDERAAWDTDGSPGSADYIADAPLDGVGWLRERTVFVATAGDEPAVFLREEDALAYVEAHGESDNAVWHLLACGPETAARMVAEAKSDD